MTSPADFSDKLHRFHEIYPSTLVVGSYCLHAYAERYNLTLPEHLMADDIDVLTTQGTFDELRNAGWDQSEFEGWPIVRDTDGSSPHTFDVGIRANGNTYEELALTAVSHRGILYMNPLELLRWKQRLNREGDERHIDFIKENVLAPWRQELSDQD